LVFEAAILISKPCQPGFEMARLQAAPKDRQTQRGSSRWGQRNLPDV